MMCAYRSNTENEKVLDSSAEMNNPACATGISVTTCFGQACDHACFNAQREEDLLSPVADSEGAICPPDSAMPDSIFPKGT